MDHQTLEIHSILEKFAPLKLGLNPTPIHRLQRLEEAFGLEQVYIKRDDLNGLGPGGNKVRNLEFLLADAIRSGCDHIIASGKSQSNLCTLAAATCNKVELKCTLVHNDLEPEHKVGNQLLNKLMGANQRFIGEVSVDERNHFVDELFKTLKRNGDHPYIIFNGGTSPIGALGYVAGVLEIAAQIENQNLPISDIFVPGGNGGLATGVVFGAACMDTPLKIQVISVENSKSELTGIMESLFDELVELTEYQPKHKFDEVCEIYGEFRGEGWGIPLREADEMIETLAQLEGIFLEKVYTAKGFNGMVELLKRNQGLAPRGSCYLHSGGFSSLFSQYP